MLAVLRVIMAILSFVTGWFLMSAVLLSLIYLIIFPMLNIMDLPSPETTLAWSMISGVFLLICALLLVALVPRRIMLKWYFRHYKYYRVKKNDNLSALLDVISKHSSSLGIKAPTLCVLRTTDINAFAFCGYVVVTEGLLATLNYKSISWVLGHELSHIKNGDDGSAVIWMTICRSLNLGGTIHNTNIRLIVGLFSRLPLFGQWIRWIAFPTYILSKIFHLVQWLSRMMFVSMDKLISRKMELRADKDATFLTHVSAGVEALTSLPRGLEPDFWGMFSTHPTSQDRLNALYKISMP